MSVYFTDAVVGRLTYGWFPVAFLARLANFSPEFPKFIAGHTVYIYIYIYAYTHV